MVQIPYSEVTFHPHSYGDPDGRLFRWEGQLYRGISHGKTAFFRQLFSDGTIQELVDQGILIGSEPTDLALDGYGMVVRHRCVPFVSYPQEWCAAMFKDAALAHLDLVRKLARRGLTLKDANPWNLVFEGCKPVHLDVASISRLGQDSAYRPYDEFCRFYLYPLILMSQGQERIARYLLPDYEGVLQSDLSMLTRRPAMPAAISSARSRLNWVLQQRVREPYRGMLKNGLRSIQLLLRKPSSGWRPQLDYLERIRAEVQSVPLPDPSAERSNCEVHSIPSSHGTLTLEQQALNKIITELRPDSILAIGSKMRWYARLAALLGKPVVCFDRDSTRITQLYYDARGTNLPVLPLIMDFTDPTPSRGLSSHVSIAAADRLQCDLVLALALVDQLVSKKSLRFDQIVDGVAQFSKHWLIVDFIAQQARNTREAQPDRFSWYTCENFINALKKRFRNVSSLPSHTEGHVLLLCEK